MAALGGTFHGTVIDGAKLAAMMRDPGGGTIRFLLVLGDEVKEEAMRLVGYGERDETDEDPRPHLRDTIVKRIIEEDGEVVVQVGSESPIALFHHNGTEPHIIRPVTAPLLVFFSKREGHVIAAKEVNHPGTKPNPFLLDAVAAVRSRH